VSASTGEQGDTFYDQIGGYDTIATIVDRFYEGVATDDVLRPLYPEEDLGPAAERFTLFLVQYWGGPTTYSDTRGHPRLRMRHAPFAIGPEERDHWLSHMRAALDELDPPPEVRAPLDEYLEMAAEAMVNR
jgi:hemoglobin